MQLTIEHLLTRSEALSSGPQIACKINELLRGPCYLDQLVEVVQYDPNMTARILHACNTAKFGGRSSVSSLKEAFSRLGNANIGRMVWQVAISQRMAGRLSAYGMEAGALWHHSMMTAIACEELWKISKQEEDIDAAFTAGLLHDIGKILIEAALFPAGAVLHDAIGNGGMTTHEAETRLLGFDHAQVGERLLAKWNQPKDMVMAVAYHHRPLEAEDKSFPTLIIVANLCARQSAQKVGTDAVPEAPEIDDAYLDILGTDREKLGGAMTAFLSRSAEVDGMMAVA